MTRIKTGPDTYTDIEPVFLGVCSATFDATNTTTPCEGGLFVGPGGGDLVAVCILGHWIEVRHVGRAFAWTDMQSRPVSADMMARITTASEPQPVRTT